MVSWITCAVGIDGSRTAVTRPGRFASWTRTALVVTQNLQVLAPSLYPPFSDADPVELNAGKLAFAGGGEKMDNSSNCQADAQFLNHKRGRRWVRSWHMTCSMLGKSAAAEGLLDCRGHPPQLRLSTQEAIFNPLCQEVSLFVVDDSPLAVL